MQPTVIYLHGFASSPASSKALFLKGQLDDWGCTVHIPDLNVPSFSELSFESMVNRLDQEVEECSPNQTVYLIGSSLGAMVALQYIDKFKQRSASRVTKLALLAPSFEFIQNRIGQLGQDGIAQWRKSGWFTFYHHTYRKDLSLHFKFIEEMAGYSFYDIQLAIPTIVIHGLRDEDVSYHQSVQFATGRANVTLKLVESDHELLHGQDALWPILVQFFGLCKGFARDGPARIEVFDLALQNDVTRFESYQNHFLAVLEKAYGDRCYSRQIHLDRIYGEKHTVLLAFLRDINDQNLIGCSYIRPDGKRSATAVLPEYQDRGIGRQLICASLELFQKQFTEVRPSNNKMKHLLMSCGFQAVTSEARLNDFLTADASLVSIVMHKNSEMLYRRSSATQKSKEHEFTMFNYEATSQLQD